MININELAIQYKKNPTKQLLDKLFYELRFIIKNKATFIYYQKKYRYGKKTLVLSETNQTTMDDVKQDMCFEIMRIIKKYNCKKPFDNYLFASLWNWKPHFLNKKFYNYLKNNPAEVIDEEGNEKSLIENIPQPETTTSELDFKEMFENLNETEKKVINLLIENNNLKQCEIAESIGVSQQRISQILEDIKKKYVY
jgi:RNA polymerase sigma factor (sigma-70 family)